MQLRAVLLHELAHLKRCDPLALLIGHMARAFHWFNPLAWLALRQMRIEQERAADDFVLRDGIRASDYASQILEIATDLHRSGETIPGALAMADPARLEGRLGAILDARKNRRRLERWIVAVSLFTAGAIVLPLAMLRVRSGEKKPSLRRAAARSNQ